MTVSPKFRQNMINLIPSLRAFATSLCGSKDGADDLVQETLVQAWTSYASFQEGTNLKAWLVTILRNKYYSQLRKTKHEVEDIDGYYSQNLVSNPEQHSHMDFADFREALEQLDSNQREALILVGASGFSYEEAAEITGATVGTLKSRVSRARHQLAELLEPNSVDILEENTASELVSG